MFEILSELVASLHIVFLVIHVELLDAVSKANV